MDTCGGPKNKVVSQTTLEICLHSFEKFTVVIIAICLLAPMSEWSHQPLNNVPSEVADFRMFHANHAISTAGDRLGVISCGIHLDDIDERNW